MTEEKVRFKYDRNWPAINAALVDLHRIGPVLLADLVRGIPNNEGQPRKRGGQPFPVRDLLYAALIRTFENKTARSTTASVERFQALELCDAVPHYNTLLRKIAKPEIMPILHKLLAVCAAPLAVIETGKLAQYAIDSTGFSTSIYASWCENKHGGEPKPNTHTATLPSRASAPSPRATSRRRRPSMFERLSTSCISGVAPGRPSVER